LLQAQCDLEERVHERTRELERANAKLHTELAARERAELTVRANQAELRALASEAALAEQSERKRLAADLHDGLSQLLTLSRIKLEGIRQHGEKVSERVGEVRGLLTQAQQHAESLTFQLSPPLLHDVGLVAAAERVAEDIERTYGLRVSVRSRGEHRPEDESIRVTVFRALRELMLNAAEHARASSLKVRFSKAARGILVIVEDDGIGYADGQARTGFGLTNARERMTYLGGSLQLERRGGGGTKATLLIPLPPLRKSPIHTAVKEA
jgi:signal transduction histidine kinase